MRWLLTPSFRGACIKETKHRISKTAEVRRNPAKPKAAFSTASRGHRLMTDRPRKASTGQLRGRTARKSKLIFAATESANTAKIRDHSAQTRRSGCTNRHNFLDSGRPKRFAFTLQAGSTYPDQHNRWLRSAPRQRSLRPLRNLLPKGLLPNQGQRPKRQPVRKHLLRRRPVERLSVRSLANQQVTHALSSSNDSST